MSSTVTETPRSGNPAAELGELLRKDFTFMRLRTELVHEAGNYLREAVALTVVVRAEGRFVEYLFACEATRHFWGRIHATGLARRVPAELEGAARRFISLVTGRSITVACAGVKISLFLTPGAWRRRGRLIGLIGLIGDFL